MFASTVLILCALTSFACTILLFRGYRRSRSRLLLWSGLGFIGLAGQNIILLVDVLVVSTVDLSFWRSVVALVGLCVLLFGLIWEIT